MSDSNARYEDGLTDWLGSRYVIVSARFGAYIGSDTWTRSAGEPTDSLPTFADTDPEFVRVLKNTPDAVYHLCPPDLPDDRASRQQTRAVGCPEW